MKDFGSYSKEQIDTLNNANDKLGLSNNMNIERNKNIIFVYSSPKVGSTSLVSSLRLSLNDKYVILHIHNEKMLKSLYDIRDIQVIDISKTTPEEQRKSEWIGDNAASLEDFLDPSDSSLTKEGHPAPTRAIIICQN